MSFFSDFLGLSGRGIRQAIVWTLLSCPFLLGGCSSNKPGSHSPVQSSPVLQTASVPEKQGPFLSPSLPLEKEARPLLLSAHPSPEKTRDTAIAVSKQYPSPLLKPGDVIRIEVVGEKESSGDFAVLSNGTIFHPLLKGFQAEGKTQEKVYQELMTIFGEYFIDPVINVSIVWKERKIYISGTSKGLESFSLPANEVVTASRVVMSVSIPESAELSQFYVIRKREGEAEQKMVVALEEILKTNDLEKDVVLEPNDLIVIEKASRIYIHGNIVRPGSFYVQKNQRLPLWELVSLAQGPTGNADLERVKILRKHEGETMIKTVSLSSEDSTSIWVQPNDIVIIPTLNENSIVTIYGEVKKSGIFNIGKETRISSILALAGGLTEYASNWIQVLRYTPDGKAQRFSVHFKRILEGNKEHDLVLQPKDVIYIDSSLF